MCVTFEGCVDGSDYVSVVSSLLSIVHQDFDLMGEHPSCQGVVSTVNPSTSMYDPVNGTFAVNGVGYPLSAVPLAVGITQLTSFNVIQARGAVTQTGPNQIYLNDDPFGAAALYVVQICGAPSAADGGI